MFEANTTALASLLMNLTAAQLGITVDSTYLGDDVVAAFNNVATLVFYSFPQYFPDLVTGLASGPVVSVANSAIEYGLTETSCPYLV